MMMNKTIPIKKIVITGENYPSQTELFKKVTNKLLDENLVTDDYFIEITKREATYPTGLLTEFGEIAIPHTDSKYVKEPFLVLVKTENSVEFKNMVNIEEPVYTQLIIFIGFVDNTKQPIILQSLMNFLSDKERMLYLQEKDGVSELKGLLDNIC